MRNIRLTIEYDGTNYSGWQIQPKNCTVQEALRNAIGNLTGETVHVQGSGRTDAGVHALGQVANFKTESTIPTEQMVMAINSELPPDIQVMEAEEASAEFHSQYDAKSKTYRYLIRNALIPSALNRNRYAWIKQPLDLAKMKDAAALFVGTHDFESFASESREKDSVRTVILLDLTRDGSLIELEIEANGFLYNMVRAIAGTLIEVGRGRFEVEDVKAMLDAADRQSGGPTAPAHGLYLVKVTY